MGCDIHLCVERRENGKWVSCDKWEKDEGGYLSVDYESRFYKGRNYNLFAILADVRNGRGFAGIKTGEGFNPISEPKGVPDDACEEYLKYVEQWGSDGHSASYFTVQELLEYDWTQFSCLQGMVDIENFEEFERYKRRTGESPSSYCGAVGGGIKSVSNEEMERRVISADLSGKYGEEYTKARQAMIDSNYGVYTMVEWTIPYYRRAGDFLGSTIWRLLQLGRPEDVRIVFLFDN